jgi:hypothetical protein
MLRVYVDSDADAHEIGTENLHKDPKLWNAILQLSRKYISTYHTKQHKMDDEETMFMYDGFLPFVQDLIREKEYDSDDPVKMTMREVFHIVYEFSERSMEDISEAVHVETLTTFMSTCSQVIPGVIPEHVSQHLYGKMVALNANVLKDPIREE